MGVKEMRAEIYAILKSIWDEPDFCVGTIQCIHTEEQAEKMLYYLETHDKPSDIVTASLFIERGLV